MGQRLLAHRGWWRLDAGYLRHRQQYDLALWSMIASLCITLSF